MSANKMANPGPLGLPPLSIAIVAMGQILNAEYGKTVMPLG